MHLHTQTARALGSEAELFLVTQDETAQTWFPKLWDAIKAFETRFSRFTHDSELSRFNARAGEEVPVSPEFMALLKRAYSFAEMTEGVFNPFILPGLQRAGYVNSIITPDVAAPDYSVREITSYTALELGDGWAKIPGNTAIDLGGIGKGYLADEIAAMLDGHIDNFCISLGGDMRVAGESESGPWIIDVESYDPERQMIYTGVLPTFGIATSGTTREKLGKTQDHLIDPTTGSVLPTSKSLCTVIAHDATTADVLASCILIKGGGYLHALLAKGAIQGGLLQQEGKPSIVLGKGFSYNR